MKVMERLDKLETLLVSQGNQEQRVRSQCQRDNSITCWNYEEEGPVQKSLELRREHLQRLTGLPSILDRLETQEVCNLLPRAWPAMLIGW